MRPLHLDVNSRDWCALTTVHLKKVFLKRNSELIFDKQIKQMVDKHQWKVKEN